MSLFNQTKPPHVQLAEDLQGLDRILEKLKRHQHLSIRIATAQFESVLQEASIDKFQEWKAENFQEDGDMEGYYNADYNELYAQYLEDTNLPSTFQAIFNDLLLRPEDRNLSIGEDYDSQTGLPIHED